MKNKILLYDLCVKNNIRFIISGVNYATEHSVIPSWGWRKDDFNHIKKIHKKFGKLKIKTFPKMYPFKKFFYEKILKKVTYLDLLDHLNVRPSVFYQTKVRNKQNA